ncbi:MAG TPA: cyclopropane-fatty-acyl-phospholipid synthase family protein [Sphingomonadaceae bacterium]|nr:cyclopropane-fatty-acyl-phospholipid synthase family protein [Sphingomonadaceae bacterium]
MFLLDRLLTRIVRAGPLTVIDAKGRRRSYGDASPATKPVTVRLADNKVMWDIAFQPPLKTGEAYMEGRLILEKGDILDLLDLVGYNARWEDDNPVRSMLWHGRHAARQGRNGRRLAKRNVAHHYDLSDRLYDLFLDADRQYSCAYFTDPANSLEQAQADKKTHIAAKLYLKPGQKVLDIGCGWGGMALYLNKVADVDVLGVTLSEEQLKVARRRAEEAGVADRVRFELIDYRDVTGSFDRIVSVGMFEHVGPSHYPEFFETCRKLLTTDGVMLLHTIGHVDGPSPTDPWVAKYIFPGGYIPALSEVAPVVEKAGLWLTDLEVLRLHYAATLEHWYERTQAARDQIIALYDERFFRMWEYYLAASIIAFRHDGFANFQFQLTRRRDALPLTRDYMLREEERMKADPPLAMAAE